MNRVVVDTDVASFHLKGGSQFEKYALELDGKEQVLSFQSLAELLYWQDIRNWGNKRKCEAAEEIRRLYIIFPFDRLLCERWASLRAESQRRGRVIHPANAWIAATAMQLGVPLASHHGKDFGGVEGLGLIPFRQNHEGTVVEPLHKNLYRQSARS